MELKGKVIQLQPIQQGTSAKGAWTKQEYILSTEGQYPKKVAFSVWNDKFTFRVGDLITAHIEIESREHNGRWYTEIRCWKMEIHGRAKESPAPSSGPVYDDPFNTPTPNTGSIRQQPPIDDSGDLPF